MKPTEPIPYVTPIGTRLLHPITTLIETLENSDLQGANEVQASPIENGYSTSIILLAVVLVESTINLLKYFLYKDKELKKPKKNSLDFMNMTYPESGLDNKLKELFVVRDVIVHSHIWEAYIFWDDDGLKFASPLPSLQKDYGDKKYTEVIDMHTRKTKSQDVNVFPTRINYADTIVVLNIVVDILLFLEQQDRRCFSSQEHVLYNGNPILFVNLVRSLKYEGYEKS